MRISCGLRLNLEESKKIAAVDRLVSAYSMTGGANFARKGPTKTVPGVANSTTILRFRLQVEGPLALTSRAGCGRRPGPSTLTTQ